MKTLFKKDDVKIKKVDDCPAVVMLLKKQKDIASQVAAVDAEILIAQRQSSDVSRQATAVLAGGEIGSVQRELDTLHHRRLVLKEALAQLDGQLGNARRTAAAELAKSYVAEYKALSQPTLEAMTKLKTSLIREREFFEAMRLAGLGDYFKERLDIPKFIGGCSYEEHVDHSLLHKHIVFRQGQGR